MEGDRQQLAINMRLARQYSIDVSPVEQLLQGPLGGDTLEALSHTDRARDRLLDLLYENPEISDARSRIIEVSAALCACDGALCRLHGQGKTERAHELGLKLLFFARELTHMRLELRHGRGKHVLNQTKASHSGRSNSSTKSAHRPDAPRAGGSAPRVGAVGFVAANGRAGSYRSYESYETSRDSR